MASNSDQDPPESRRTRRPEDTTGFGYFKARLAGLLTLQIAIELATFFEYPHALINQLMYTDETVVGNVMVSKMEERGNITPTDISQLLSTLLALNYNGVAEAVRRLFEQTYCKTIGNSGKTGIFIRNLKLGYQRLINAVRPVPFKHIWRSVNTVFIECNLERMEEERESESGLERWSRIRSHIELLTNSDNRVILEGDPGYGKSTLCLQIAYEWCESLLPTNVDVLILLRLREVGDMNIYQAIKKFILPRECPLSVADIESILAPGKIRIYFLFDGFDDFHHPATQCDVNDIIKSFMFPLTKVITTSRPGCLPDLPNARVTRMRLRGFDEQMQIHYLTKSVVKEGDSITVADIMGTFNDNFLLAAICQTPLFFAMFAHLWKNNPGLRKSLQSVTAHIMFMINCFLSHDSSKSMVPCGQKSNSECFEELSFPVAEIAFQGLKVQNKILEWEGKVFEQTVGGDSYRKFIKAGILVLEHRFEDIETFGKSIGNENIKKVQVKFFHKSFQEFFSAVHLNRMVANKSSPVIHGMLNEFDPKELTSFFLFACGLSETLAEHIISYLLGRGERCRDTLMLCILELQQVNQFVLNAVTSLCAETVSIYSSDSKLKQRAIVHLLHTASSHKIPISGLCFNWSYGSAAADGSAIRLRSGISLPSLSSVENIVIWMKDGREVSEEELSGLLAYAKKCSSLDGLFLYRCLLPQSVPADTFRDSMNNVEVTWLSCAYGDFLLNNKTGRWQPCMDEDDLNEDKELTESGYVDLVERFRNMWQRHTMPKQEYFCETRDRNYRSWKSELAQNGSITTGVGGDVTEEKY